MTPENRSNEDAAQLIAAHDANPPQGPWDECDGCHVEYVRSLLARIAAVEAERDALAVIIANEAQTLRAYHIGRLAADNPVDAAHLADHLDAELRAALAASPTPTEPTEETP